MQYLKGAKIRLASLGELSATPLHSSNDVSGAMQFRPHGLRFLRLRRPVYFAALHADIPSWRSRDRPALRTTGPSTLSELSAAAFLPRADFTVSPVLITHIRPDLVSGQAKWISNPTLARPEPQSSGVLYPAAARYGRSNAIFRVWTDAV